MDRKGLDRFHRNLVSEHRWESQKSDAADQQRHKANREHAEIKAPFLELSRRNRNIANRANALFGFNTTDDDQYARPTEHAVVVVGQAKRTDLTPDHSQVCVVTSEVVGGKGTPRSQHIRFDYRFVANSELDEHGIKTPYFRPDEEEIGVALSLRQDYLRGPSEEVHMVSLEASIKDEIYREGESMPLSLNRRARRNRSKRLTELGSELSAIESTLDLLDPIVRQYTPVAQGLGVLGVGGVFEGQPGA